MILYAAMRGYDKSVPQNSVPSHLSEGDGEGLATATVRTRSRHEPCATTRLPWQASGIASFRPAPAATQSAMLSFQEPGASPSGSLVQKPPNSWPMLTRGRWLGSFDVLRTDVRIIGVYLAGLAEVERLHYDSCPTTYVIGIARSLVRSRWKDCTHG
jgi:hypothetical protein